MSELYWLGVLGSLHACGEVVVFLSILVLLGFGIWTITFGSDYEEPFKMIKRKVKCSIYALVFNYLCIHPFHKESAYHLWSRWHY